MPKLTQKNFDNFCETQANFSEALNHRMTRIEENVEKMKINVTWMKLIGYYMATLLTAIVVKSIFIK